MLLLSTHLSEIHTTRPTPLRLSSPYHQLDWSLELHNWGFWARYFAVVLWGPLHWPVHGSIGRRMFTLCSSEVSQQLAWSFPVPFHVLRREEWEVAAWSTDLNLKGCAVIDRGESGQLCYTCPLSIHGMTAAGLCIQSEALNVDTTTITHWYQKVCFCSWTYFTETWKWIWPIDHIHFKVI